MISCNQRVNNKVNGCIQTRNRLVSAQKPLTTLPRFVYWYICILRALTKPFTVSDRHVWERNFMSLTIPHY